MLAPIEIVALVVAAIIFIKVISLLVFPKHFEKFVKSYFSKTGWQNYWSYILFGLFLIVAYVVFTAVPISHIAATFFLFGLYMHFAIFLVFPKDLKQLTQHVIRNPGKFWLAISVSLIIAVVTIFAILL